MTLTSYDPLPKRLSPTATSAEIQRAIARCGWHRSPFVSKTQPSWSKNHNCSRTMMTSFSNCEITVRSNVNQVVYHTSPSGGGQHVSRKSSAAGSDTSHS